MHMDIEGKIEELAEPPKKKRVRKEKPDKPKEPKKRGVPPSGEELTPCGKYLI